MGAGVEERGIDRRALARPAAGDERGEDRGDGRPGGTEESRPPTAW
jgi:hypothetical protein